MVLRHAEKADDGTRNPPLTDAGNERAERTAALLASLDVAAVVSTPYTRTEQTAKPIAELFSLDVETYDPRKAGDALDRLGREHAGRVVVVVGHSNTVPAIVRALGADPGVEQIDEAEYGRVYLVTPVEGAEPVCHLLRS
ncbi:MAG: hypothetical protein DHS20C14_16070 [Phycisphaeraceae bacterium]|nr:MAG: hypothetical protein DHS20C14_16070 [Phycisphaeraceae bacterium]